MRRCAVVSLRRRRLVFAILLVLTIGVSVAATAEGQAASSTPRAQLDVRSTLLGLYPELRQGGLVFDEVTTPSGFSVRVSERARPEDGPRSRGRLVLNADATLDGAQNISDLTVSGPLVRDASNRALARRLRVEADGDAVVASEPLRLGLAARDQAGAAVPLTALRGTGATATVSSVQPQRVSRAREGAATSPPPLDRIDYGLLWRVDVLVRTAGQSDVVKSVYLEPYDGRVVRVTRRAVQQ